MPVPALLPCLEHARSGRRLRRTLAQCLAWSPACRPPASELAHVLAAAVAELNASASPAAYAARRCERWAAPTAQGDPGQPATPASTSRHDVRAPDPAVIALITAIGSTGVCWSCTPCPHPRDRMLCHGRPAVLEASELHRALQDEPELHKPLSRMPSWSHLTASYVTGAPANCRLSEPRHASRAALPASTIDPERPANRFASRVDQALQAACPCACAHVAEGPPAGLDEPQPPPPDGSLELCRTDSMGSQGDAAEVGPRHASPGSRMRRACRALGSCCRRALRVRREEPANKRRVA